MQDKKQVLTKLIDRYLNGQLNAEEKSRMEQWMHELDVSEESVVDLDKQKDVLKQRIDARLQPLQETANRRSFTRQWIAVAAAVLIAMLASVYYKRLEQQMPAKQQLLSAKVLRATISTWQTILNTSAKDTVIDLQDGTRVRLLAKSSLTLKIPFESFRRDVQLEGKAFFEVAHDKKRPFSVLSGNILTTALGTSFWVEQSHAGAKPQVRLITGRVSIKQHDEHGNDMLLAYLEPGQDWHEQKVSKAKASVSEPILLADEKPLAMSLFFHHKPLAEVLPELASFYDTQIIFSTKELAGLSFYGAYDHKNRVEQILETICIANDLEMEWDEQQKTFTIHKIN